MDDEQEPPEDEERSTLVRNALLTALAAVVIIGVVIALGTTLVVRALGLDDTTSGPVGSGPTGEVQPLPSSALPVPGESGGSSPSAKPKPRTGKIQLDVSPLQAGPMQRVNMTGRYRGADNTQLQVQRYEDGTWSDFGVQATVRVGTYTTYIMTGRAGENRFRMFDPQTKEASNVVTVTIG
jgi:hypothetical protein